MSEHTHPAVIIVGIIVAGTVAGIVANNLTSGGGWHAPASAPPAASASAPAGQYGGGSSLLARQKACMRRLTDSGRARSCFINTNDEVECRTDQDLADARQCANG